MIYALTGAAFVENLDGGQFTLFYDRGWVSLLMAASFLRLAVQLARDASDALESNEIVMLVVEEQPDEVMVGGKLA